MQDLVLMGQNEQSIEARVRIDKEFFKSKDNMMANVYHGKTKTGANDFRLEFLTLN